MEFKENIISWPGLVAGKNPVLLSAYVLGNPAVSAKRKVCKIWCNHFFLAYRRVASQLLFQGLHFHSYTRGSAF